MPDGSLPHFPRDVLEHAVAQVLGFLHEHRGGDADGEPVSRDVHREQVASHHVAHDARPGELKAMAQLEVLTPARQSGEPAGQDRAHARRSSVLPGQERLSLILSLSTFTSCAMGPSTLRSSFTLSQEWMTVEWSFLPKNRATSLSVRPR